MKAIYFLLSLSFFLLTVCPDLSETIDCGSQQIEINSDCGCEEEDMN